MAFSRVGLVLVGAVAALAGSASGAAAQGLRHDGNLPIEITADELEVEQPQNLATFTGNVDAVQGELVLSADRLRVYYYGSGEESPAGASSSIRRIEADGNVFLSSPRETAQGTSGVYDVAGNQLSLEGSVVLTQDDNVIRGERLEIDLVSGYSRVLAAAPGGEGGAPPQRVRAIFTPQSFSPAAAPTAAAGQ
jgi:lipopolysaccharide export system protein LptA